MCRDAFKAQVTERRAEEIARLRREADRRRRDLTAQKKRERLEARKVKYVERSREHVLSLHKELEIKAQEQAEADRKCAPFLPRVLLLFWGCFPVFFGFSRDDFGYFLGCFAPQYT